WAESDPQTRELPVGYFGSSTGAAAALIAAALPDSRVGAIVSRGGRPDLAGAMADVRAPTLRIVGGLDTGVIELKRSALTRRGGGRAVVRPQQPARRGGGRAADRNRPIHGRALGRRGRWFALLRHCARTLVHRASGAVVRSGASRNGEQQACTKANDCTDGD